MKKVLNSLLIILSITLISSCKQKKEEAPPAKNEQMSQVMAIHDEVMPKMSSIGKLVAELKAIEDSTEIGLQYQGARKDLQDAHKSMMDWMKGIGERFDRDEIMNGKALTEQKQIWLDEEEVKVKALREQINSSIAKAEELLENK